jgi:hypothetical protein
MLPLRVLVAHTQAGLCAEIVAEALASTDDVHVVGKHPIAAEEIEAKFEQCDTDIDVLITMGPGFGAIGERLLLRYPSLVISHIEVAPSILNIKLRNVGLDGLLAALRELAQKPWDAPAARRLAFRLITRPETAPDPVIEIVEGRDDERRVPEHVIRWLDVSLLTYYRTSPCSPLHGGSALCRSAESIEAMLSANKIETPDDEDCETLADRLFEPPDVCPDNGALYALWHRLKLTRAELCAVALALAPELDHRYQFVYGCMQDDMMRRFPSLGLVCAVLGDPAQVRLALAGAGGLRRWRLFAAPGEFACAEDPVLLDPGVAAWLLGDRSALLADAVQGGIVREAPWLGADWIGDADDARHEAGEATARAVLAAQLARLPGPARWIALTGVDTDGARAMLETVAARSGHSPMRIGLARLAALEPAQLRAMAIALARAARLQGLFAVVDASDASGADIERHALSELRDAFAALDTPGVLIEPSMERFAGEIGIAAGALIRRAPASPEATAARLRRAAREAGIELGPADAGRLVRSQPLSFATLHDALGLASASGVAHLPAPRRIAALADCLHKVSAPHLSHFARRVTPSSGLDHVILPDDRRAQLDEMVSHVEHASKVLGEWGFEAGRPLSRGVAALFCGPSGTGKSMAAEAVAHALHTDAYLVDLSQVVSKYIGESEKNLDIVFAESEQAGAMLVFNEADALFSKRGEVRDAHDRYANMEVAYLLQRIELFSGLAILTSNLRQNIDAAFLRRLRFVIDFPKPDVAAREAIWRQCLPPSAPLAPGVNLGFLARRLDLTGGSISQITLRAAFAAAREGCARIEFRHLIDATRSELLKNGMTNAERDLAVLAASYAPDGARAA